MKQGLGRVFVGGALLLAVSAAFAADSAAVAGSAVIYGCVDGSGALRIVSRAGECKKKETALAWNQQGPVGPQGAKGATGAAGPAGAAGPTGPQGPQGVQGLTGTTGLQGIAGPAGPQGPKGDPGTPGSAAPTPALLPAAFTLGEDVFMSVDQIAGDSTDSAHRNDFNVTAFALSVHADNAKPTWSLAVTVPVSSGSPALHSRAATAAPIATVSFDFVKAGGSRFTFLQLALQDVRVLSMNDTIAGSAGSSTLTLGFGSIKITATPQLSDGSAGASVVGTWDLNTNTGAGPDGGNPAPLMATVGTRSNTDTLTVQSFSPPAQQGSTFGDAAVTYTTDTPQIINQLIDTAGQEPIPSADIDLFKQGGFRYASYGFTDVRLHSVVISGDIATTGFNASAFEWTIIPQLASGAPGPAQVSSFP